MNEKTELTEDDIQFNAVPRIGYPFRLQWEKAQNAYVLLYPEGMVKLNPSAGHILSRCDGESTVGAIVADLEQNFPEAEKINADILAFLSDAHSQGWVVYE
jgi:pyrroloquinoline quinone biosynthesis protein D